MISKNLCLLYVCVFILLFSSLFVLSLNENTIKYNGIHAFFDDDGWDCSGDWGEDNSNAGVVNIKFGTQIKVISQNSLDWSSIIDHSTTSADSDVEYLNFWCRNVYSSNALICSDDHFWHECKADKDDDSTVTWVNNKLYNCTKDVSVLDEPISEGSEKVAYSKIANRFRCYQDGDKLSWAEK